MTAFKDLRDFLQLLETQKQLLRIVDEVSLEPDLAAAGRAINQVAGENSPAIHFTRLKGYQNAEVVMNVHGSWPNLALVLGMPKDSTLNQQFFEFIRRYQQFPGTMQHLNSAPWQEVVVEKEINLFSLLPLFRLNQGDGGFYLDKACIISRDLDDWDNEDVQNVGMYRLQVKDKSRLGIQPVPQHDIAIHIEHAEARGQDLPVVIAVGNEPIIAICAAMEILYDQSEYKMAAVLQGSPYPVVKSSKGLDVPWGSQYVLEGRILARQRELEGPFGEFPGEYSGCRNYPVIEIDKISHRKSPLYEALYLGLPWTELDYMCAINTSAPIYVQLKNEYPEIVAVNAIITLGFIIVVSTKVRYGGFAKAIGLRVMSMPHGLGYAKMVIVVDEDVDPFDMKRVMWAVSTKVNPAGDVIILPNMSVDVLDPASQPQGITHKMVIDATTPVPPDNRGNFGEELAEPAQTDIWRKKLAALLKETHK
ncbi:MAG: non-oxidative hydroxyarylic acid decarboxylases subunit C [Candidatus Acidiferrum sp.]|jgi:UbiD family decarboxylase